MQSTFFAVIEIVGLHRGLSSSSTRSKSTARQPPLAFLRTNAEHTRGHNQRALGNCGGFGAISNAICSGPTAPAWRCLLGIKGVGSIRPIIRATFSMRVVPIVGGVGVDLERHGERNRFSPRRHCCPPPIPELIPREVILPGHRPARVVPHGPLSLNQRVQCANQ